MSSVSRRPSSHVARQGWKAALASAVIPGWGHLYAGRRRKAQQLFVIDAVLLLLVLGVLRWFSLDLLKLFVSPAGLVGITVVSLGLLGYRTFAVADSYRAAQGRPLRWSGGVGMVLAIVLLAVPHATLAYLTFIQFDLIESVFAEPDPVAGPPLTASTTVPTTSGEDPVVTTTSTIPTTTTTPPPIWDGLERLNIVLLGADAGAGRRGIRTDTTIVVSIDPETGYVAMFSVPRDLSNAPLPEGMGRWDCQCFPDLITHLYDGAVRNPEAFPGPGDPPINAIKGALSEIFGIPIHYYAMVTLDGFVGLIDALGGVTIDVPKTIVDEIYPHEDGTVESVVIEAGTQHLDGHLALAYARIRRHSDDFARMHRQRCVIEALVEQTSPVEIVARFGRIAEAIKQNVQTDIPQDRLGDFVGLLPKLSTHRIATLRITRAEYQTGSSPGRVYYDIDRIRADAQALIADPEAAQAELGLSSLDATCAESFD